MSFSSDVKLELMQNFQKSEKCRKAELAALMLLGSRYLSLDKQTGVYIYSDPKIGTESQNGFTSQRKTFSIKGGLGKISDINEITKRPDEKRAFLRGAFIAGGTMANPDKEYHLEILLPDDHYADIVSRMMEAFDIHAKQLNRKDKVAVYIKDSEEISSMLNVMEAHLAMMEFENARIEHEINENVNRRINCDTANINKQVAAAMKQIEDIELIQEKITFEKLDAGLAAVCIARLENPDATLQEIADMMTPKVSKSGVNHRFRKIAAMAESIRKQ